jgi:hypothetical protein
MPSTALPRPAGDTLSLRIRIAAHISATAIESCIVPPFAD